MKKLLAIPLLFLFLLTSTTLEAMKFPTPTAPWMGIWQERTVYDTEFTWDYTHLDISQNTIATYLTSIIPLTDSQLNNKIKSAVTGGFLSGSDQLSYRSGFDSSHPENYFFINQYPETPSSPIDGVYTFTVSSNLFNTVSKTYSPSPLHGVPTADYISATRTLSWAPVGNLASDGGYQVSIFPMENGQVKDKDHPIFISDFLDNTVLSYTFSGNPFQQPGQYALRVEADQISPANRPYLSSSYSFMDKVSFYTQALQPIPEPVTLLLLGSGLIGLAGLGRRKRIKHKSD